MSFEVRERDILARIGKLKTKSGKVETPLLFPVVNPAVQPIPPKKIEEVFGCEALITNAYILKKRFGEKPVETGIHKFLDFNRAVMTDSGAYQILVYGDVEITPKEIVRYQEQIDTDIATILDLPTGWNVSRRQAEKTVKETIRRAKELFKLKTRDDVLWVGPIQGGVHLDLVAKSAVEMSKLPFQIHALGSPTEVMEHYRFDVLVDMIMTAKMNLPLERPFHLFGAGHPFMFALAIALGCDLFDSAAYAIYAREKRYMTEYGTSKLDDLDYFPCSCPKCVKMTPKEVLELPQNERQAFLAEHNLYVCITELKRIKKAIKEGRLWEHLEIRAHGHPALLQAVKKLKKYEEFIERHSPLTKRRGIFFFNSLGLLRPEVVRYRKRMIYRYTPPMGVENLMLIPQTKTKPFHKSKIFKEIMKVLKRETENFMDKFHICFYVAPFGVIPTELDEVYPLSQYEITVPPDEETRDYVARQVIEYINRTNYKRVIFIHDEENWGAKVFNACKKACLKKEISFSHLKLEDEIKELLERLKEVLRKNVTKS
ncbi:tRNA guanosine(15) transglycosylase TgtA [Candidatus Bathyarchaeota archaeon]|nr:tRNA guanosine(15) transglycosylase TgtA [Candidatus Bathyarchaeota archaeon]